MAEMKQLLLIINPTAGKKKAVKNLAEIISIFNRAEYDTHVYMTVCRGDATNAVKRLGANMDIIVCCGGDGTLNETIAGVIEAGIETPIGYIPAGSTNDFANSLHLSHKVLDAATQIVEGKAVKYDVGKFSDRYFSYVASFGAFTKASYATPQSIKNTLGHMAYLLEGIHELLSIHKEHIRMELDGETVEGDYLFGAICNSTSVGGVITLNPDSVDMSDGKFEVLLIRAPKDLGELHGCIKAIKKQKYDSPMITFRSASNIKVYANPDMPWSLDGEKADGSEEILIDNLHCRIQLVH